MLASFRKWVIQVTQIGIHNHRPLLVELSQSNYGCTARSQLPKRSKPPFSQVVEAVCGGRLLPATMQ